MQLLVSVYLRNYAVTGKGKFFQLSVVFAEHGPKKKILSYVPDSESLGILWRHMKEGKHNLKKKDKKDKKDKKKKKKRHPE